MSETLFSPIIIIACINILVNLKFLRNLTFRFWQKRQYVLNANKSSSEKICVHTILIFNTGSKKPKDFMLNEIKC